MVRHEPRPRLPRRDDPGRRPGRDPHRPAGAGRSAALSGRAGTRRVAAAAYLLAALLLTTGTLHFVAADVFEGIVPTFLGPAAFWVAASGVAELACALGLAVPTTRRLAAWATLALFVVVFPANVTMTVHAVQGHGSELISWARLPLQVPLVLWAWWIARRTLTADGRVARWPLSPGERG